MKFDGKPTVSSRAKAVEDRLGKTTGASKGSKPAPKAKIRPTGNPLKGKIGIKWTKKF
jgi:hypothetical protein